MPTSFMVLTLSQALALASACAPAIAPQTLLSVAMAESGLDPLAIGINGRRDLTKLLLIQPHLTQPYLTKRAATRAHAAQKAAALIAAGVSVDLGLAQINSQNLGRLGLSVTAAFDPCANLAAAAQLLQAGYLRARPQVVGQQPALRTALSIYNSGHKFRGFRSGYVGKVVSAAAQIAPAIAAAQGLPQAPPSGAAGSAPAPSPPASSPPAWDVFGQTAPAPGFFVRLTPPSSGDRP